MGFVRTRAAAAPWRVSLRWPEASGWSAAVLIAAGALVLGIASAIGPSRAWIALGERDGEQVVVAVEPGSLAWLAHVREGDPVTGASGDAVTIGAARLRPTVVDTVLLQDAPGPFAPVLASLLMLAAVIARRVGQVGSTLLLVLSGSLLSALLLGHSIGLAGSAIAAAPGVIAFASVGSISSRWTRALGWVCLAATFAAVAALALATDDHVAWDVAWLAPSIAGVGLVTVASTGDTFAALRRWRQLPRRSRTLSELMAEVTPAVRRARLRALEEERDRLALDMHDEVLPRVHRSLRRLDEADPQASAELRDIEAGLRRLMNARQTVVLRYGGLRPALEAAVEDAGDGVRVRVVFDVLDGDLRLPEDVQLAAYRIAVEALNNAARHASATTVELRVVQHEYGSLDATVTDDGHGLDPAMGRRIGHLGLDEMHQRARDVSGSLHIGPAPTGTGTQVRFRWPA